MAVELGPRGPGPRPGRRRRLFGRPLSAASLALALAFSAGLVATALVATGLVGAGLGWKVSFPKDILRLWTPKVQGIDPAAPVDPGREYHLTVWDYRLPFVSAGGAPFAEATEEAIERFRRRHPNVTVDLVLIDLAEGPAKLAEALAAGYPPDVYCSPFGLPFTGSDLQVPVGLYLDYQTWSRYDPLAWQAVKLGRTVWAWPRFMLIWPWLGNADLMKAAGIDVERVSREGWTREEFSAMAARLGASVGSGRTVGSGGTTGTAALVTSCPAAVLRDLLLPGRLAAAQAAPVQGEAGAEATDPGGGDAADLSAGAEAVVEWLTELRAGGALAPGASLTDPGALDSFIKGRSAVLAGLSPWTADFLFGLQPRPRPWQYSLPPRPEPPRLVLLPPPHGPDEPSAVWLSAATVAVFRQARYRGDDNTRLAAELGAELTLGLRPWLWNEPLCVPSSLCEQASWEVRAPKLGEAGVYALRALEELRALPTGAVGSALQALTYGPGAGSYVGGKGPSAMASAGYLGPYLAGPVAEEAARFWDGEGSADTLLRLLTGGPETPGGTGDAGP